MLQHELELAIQIQIQIKIQRKMLVEVDLDLLKRKILQREQKKVVDLLVEVVVVN